MVKITTKKHGEGCSTKFEIFVNDEYFGMWFGYREEDAIAFAERNMGVIV